MIARPPTLLLIAQHFVMLFGKKPPYDLPTAWDGLQQLCRMLPDGFRLSNNRVTFSIRAQYRVAPITRA